MNIFRQTLGIVDRLLSRRVRIKMCTHVFNFQFQLSLRSLLCAFKCHVFKEMGNAVVFIVLEATACVNPQTNSCGRNTGVFRCHAHSVRELSHLRLGNIDGGACPWCKLLEPSSATRQTIGRSQKCLLWAYYGPQTADTPDQSNNRKCHRQIEL